MERGRRCVGFAWSVKKLTVANVAWLAGNPVFVPRVLDVEKGQLCFIIGTVYMDMPLKPNVLEDVARDVSLPIDSGVAINIPPLRK